MTETRKGQVFATETTRRKGQVFAIYFIPVAGFCIVGHFINKPIVQPNVYLFSSLSIGLQTLLDKTEDFQGITAILSILASAICIFASALTFDYSLAHSQSQLLSGTATLQSAVTRTVTTPFIHNDWYDVHRGMLILTSVCECLLLGNTVFYFFIRVQVKRKNEKTGEEVYVPKPPKKNEEDCCCGFFRAKKCSRFFGEPDSNLTVSQWIGIVWKISLMLTLVNAMCELSIVSFTLYYRIPMWTYGESPNLLLYFVTFLWIGPLLRELPVKDQHKEREGYYIVAVGLHVLGLVISIWSLARDSLRIQELGNEFLSYHYFIKFESGRDFSGYYYTVTDPTLTKKFGIASQGNHIFHILAIILAITNLILGIIYHGRRYYETSRAHQTTHTNNNGKGSRREI